MDPRDILMGSERKTALVHGSLDGSGVEAALSLVEERIAKVSALVATEVTRRRPREEEEEHEALLGTERLTTVRPAFINQCTSALWIYGKGVL